MEIRRCAMHSGGLTLFIEVGNFTDLIVYICTNQYFNLSYTGYTDGIGLIRFTEVLRYGTKVVLGEHNWYLDTNIRTHVSTTGCSEHCWTIQEENVLLTGIYDLIWDYI